jgi:hypothetical protein
VADNVAMRGPYPVRVVDLSTEGPLPSGARQLSCGRSDRNLNLANMDWEEFATAVDVDGMYYGFD